MGVGVGVGVRATFARIQSTFSPPFEVLRSSKKGGGGGGAGRPAPGSPLLCDIRLGNAS